MVLVHRSFPDLVSHIAREDQLLHKALTRIDKELTSLSKSMLDVRKELDGTVDVVGSGVGWKKVGGELSPIDVTDEVGIGTSFPQGRFDVSNRFIIDNNGRLKATAVPNYDLAAGVFSADVMIDVGNVFDSGYGDSFTMPSGKQHTLLNLSGTLDTITPAAVTIFSGLRFFFENKGTNLNSELKAIVGGVNITSGGHARGIYATATADAGATGFINCFSARIHPVSTLLGAYGMQMQNFGDPGKTVGFYIDQDDASSDYQIGIMFGPLFEATDAAIRLRTGSGRSFIRWDEMVIANNVSNVIEFSSLVAYPIFVRINAHNGSYSEFGELSEEVTLSTSGLTTDSVLNLLPGDSIIRSVMARITQTISGGGVTSVTIGDSSLADRFANLTVLTAGQSTPGIRHWSTQLNAASHGPRQANPAKVRITAVGGTPTQGKIRLVVVYEKYVSPTS